MSGSMGFVATLRVNMFSNVTMEGSHRLRTLMDIIHSFASMKATVFNCVSPWSSGMWSMKLFLTEPSFSFTTKLRYGAIQGRSKFSLFLGDVIKALLLLPL